MSASSGDLLSGFFEGDLEKLETALVAPDDLIERYKQIFGDGWDGEPVVTEGLSGPATVHPVETDDPDVLSLAVTTRIGEEDCTFTYNMYLTAEALRRSIETRGFDFWDSVDSYGPALNRIHWALFGIPEKDAAAVEPVSVSEIRPRKLGRILRWFGKV